MPVKEIQQEPFSDVLLTVSITLEGPGTFVLPLPGEGQITNLHMKDSTGKKMRAYPYNPCTSTETLNTYEPFNMGLDYPSSGEPVRTIQFSCAFRHLTSPQAEWLHLNGNWAVQICKNPQRLMLEQIVKPSDSETPQTYYLHLPGQDIQEDGDIVCADPDENMASIQAEIDKDRKTLVCTVKCPATVSIQDLIVLDASGQPLPRLRRTQLPEIMPWEQNKTQIVCFYEMEDEQGVRTYPPSDMIPEELRIGVIFLPHINRENVPINLIFNPCQPEDHSAKQAEEIHENSHSLQPPTGIHAVAYKWQGFTRPASGPSMFTLIAYPPAGHGFLRGRERTGTCRMHVSSPEKSPAIPCQVLPIPRNDPSTYQFINLLLPQPMPTGNKGWQLKGELCLPCGKIKTTQTQAMPAKEGRACMFDVPSSSVDYPPFQLHATLVSLKTTAIGKNTAVFRLKGCRNKPHFSQFRVQGGSPIQSREDPDDQTANLVTFSFDQFPDSFDCSVEYIVNPVVIRHPLNMRVGLGGVVSEESKK